MRSENKGGYKFIGKIAKMITPNPIKKYIKILYNVRNTIVRIFETVDVFQTILSLINMHSASVKHTCIFLWLYNYILIRKGIWKTRLTNKKDSDIHYCCNRLRDSPQIICVAQKLQNGLRLPFVLLKSCTRYHEIGLFSSYHLETVGDGRTNTQLNIFRRRLHNYPVNS